MRWVQDQETVRLVQGQETVRLVQGQETVRLFRLITGSAGLFEDKKIYIMVSNERCENMC